MKTQKISATCVTWRSNANHNTHKNSRVWLAHAQKLPGKDPSMHPDLHERHNHGKHISHVWYICLTHRTLIFKPWHQRLTWQDSSCIVRASLCSSCSGSSWSNSSSEQAIVAFKGVRNSWLIFAMKAVLAQEASRALSLALCTKMPMFAPNKHPRDSICWHAWLKDKCNIHVRGLLLFKRGIQIYAHRCEEAR